jgi:hypothetical protein
VERDAPLLAQWRQWLPTPPPATEIQTHAADFLDPGCPCLGHRHDLVLANAVFDLLPAAAFAALLERCLAQPGASPTFLFTLHLDGPVRFLPLAGGPDLDPEAPPDPESAHWAGLYDAHMRRPQPGGRAMGSAAAATLRAIMQSRGLRVESAASPWRIGPDNPAAQRAKLAFLAAALPEVLAAPAERAAFAAWLARQAARITAGTLAIHVPHQDHLAYRP